MLVGCRDEPLDRPAPGDAAPPIATKLPVEPPPDSKAPLIDAAPARTRLVVMAAGDVSLGRDVGQRILRDASFDPFADLRPLLSRADVSFANLESPLSEQNGETEHPTKPLTFVGPPSGAALVARAPFHVVSLANNHVWDYGERGFLDTLDALEAANVRYTGVSRRAGEQYRPLVVRMNGWSIAFIAVTHVWNPGDFRGHEADERVAWADDARLVEAVRRARSEHDLVLVSYHGGREYSETPAQEPFDVAKLVMAAGADAVLAHHPHVPQGVGWFDERPVFYSLGNFVFGKYRDLEWTARGFVARLTFEPDGKLAIAACPYRIDAGVPRRVTASDWPRSEGVFRSYLRRASSYASVAGTRVGDPDELGCLALRSGAE
jgi:poly-gamma-glutamate synthesis protein (capsule biosynthesis protein)